MYTIGKVRNLKSKTQELLESLKLAGDIKEFFNAHENDFINQSPGDILSEILEKKRIPLSEAARLSGVGNYVYKLCSGERKASRNVIIAIAVGCGFTYEETQLVLRVSKLAILDSRDKRDSAVIYAITNGMSVFELDDMLDENGLDTIN